MKALCSERYEDWTNRFSSIGLKCMELTGDTEMDDYFDLQDVHIILTTPVRCAAVGFVDLDSVFVLLHKCEHLKCNFINVIAFY